MPGGHFGITVTMVLVLHLPYGSIMEWSKLLKFCKYFFAFESNIMIMEKWFYHIRGSIVSQDIHLPL